MDVPEHLWPAVGQVLNCELHGAIVRGLWAVVYNLTPFRDGNRWCVLLGPDIQSGIAAFGKTPQEAIFNFDRAMAEEEGTAYSPNCQEER